MRPKPLKWRKWSSGLLASMPTRLGHYEITVGRDESKAAGEEIWRSMVMELLEGDE